MTTPLNLVKRTLPLLKKQFAIRQSQLQAIRRKHEISPHGGDPRNAVPFGKSVGRPVKMTVLYILFFGVAFWAPDLLFMYLMIKQGAGS